MRVCDITKTDEQVAVITISRVDESTEPMSGSTAIITLDVGQSALDAITSLNWAALDQLQNGEKPRAKSPTRVAGARKAAETRRHRKEEAERARLAAERAERDIAS